MSKTLLSRSQLPIYSLDNIIENTCPVFHRLDLSAAVGLALKNEVFERSLMKTSTRLLKLNMRYDCYTNTRVVAEEKGLSSKTSLFLPFYRILLQ